MQLATNGAEPCHECIDDRPATFREASQLPLCRSGKPVAGQPPRSPNTQTLAFEGPIRTRLGLLVVNLSAQEEACVYKNFFCATATSPIMQLSQIASFAVCFTKTFELLQQYLHAFAAVCHHSCTISLVPRPRIRREKWPGIHCLRMRERFRKFSANKSEYGQVTLGCYAEK